MVCSRKEQRKFPEGMGSSVRDPKLPYVRTPQRVVFGTFKRLASVEFTEAELHRLPCFVRRNSAVTLRASAKLCLQRSDDARHSSPISR